MTYPITRTDLAILRNELRTVTQKSSELEAGLRALRREHDAHLREIAAERDKREHRRMIRLMIFIGIIWILNVILWLIP